jgi:nucleotide-binding universal stress UspA family protein
MSLTIVVPLDGSQLAEAALPWARSMVDRNAARVVLISVIEMPTEFAAWVTANQLSETPEMADVFDERRAYLEEQAAKHGLDSAVIDLRVGAPAREILTCISEQTDSQPLVVMSTHGYGGIKRLAFGSVALQVIHDYAGPIMTVRDESPVTEPRLERLLLPIDGSDFSAVAIERALDILGEPYPQLHLVRVLGTPTWAIRSINHGLVAEYLAASRELAQQQLDELRDKTAASGHDVTCELRPHGNVVDEIIDAAESAEVDAIAMCTHGLGGIGRIVLGSVADGVLRHSTRPVLLLRPEIDH